MGSYVQFQNINHALRLSATFCLRRPPRRWGGDWGVRRDGPLGGEREDRRSAYTAIPLYLGKTALDVGIEMRWHAAF